MCWYSDRAGGPPAGIAGGEGFGELLRELLEREGAS